MNSTPNRMSRYNIHIKDIIGNKDIQNINKNNIENLLKEIETTGKSNQTLKSVKRTLKLGS